MIKLLALDLDGTLLNSQGEIPDKNLEAIQQAEEQGVLVTIVTGRRFRDARPVALKLNLNAPLISHNGALTKYADSLEIVSASILPNETIREILRIGKDFGADAMLSSDPHGKGILLYDRVSNENLPLQKYLAWSRRLHGDEADKAVLHVESLEKILDDYETVHVSFSGTCGAMAELQSVLENFGLQTTILTTVYRSMNFTLVDILPFGASKGTGLERLATFENIQPENVMAMGDNFNDLEMLEFAGTGVLMGNALPELLDLGTFHETLSNDEAGVAAAIEKFILNG